MCNTRWELGQQILREHNAPRKGVEVAFGTEMNGEAWPPKARAGGSDPGHPNKEAGEPGDYLEKARNGNRLETPFGARNCIFKRDEPAAFGRL